jgi:hypothetical protein
MNGFEQLKAIFSKLQIAALSLAEPVVLLLFHTACLWNSAAKLRTDDAKWHCKIGQKYCKIVHFSY